MSFRDWDKVILLVFTHSNLINQANKWMPVKSFKIYFIISLAITIYDYYFVIWYIFSLEKIMIFHHAQGKRLWFSVSVQGK